MANPSGNGSTPSPCALRKLRRGVLGIIGASTLLWGQQADAQVNVTTYHYDTASTGQNLSETTLTPLNVNATQFGKLFSYPVDGFAYAQPLYLTGVFVPGRGLRNVVFVATEHDSVYAFDADNPNPSTGGGKLWQRVFINPAAGITTVPTLEVYPNVNFPDIRPEIGITGTPVIDYDAPSGRGTLYVVVKTREVRVEGEQTNRHYVQKLYALDVGTGADTIAPRLIGDTIFNGSGPYTHAPENPCVTGTGDGSQAGKVCFNSLRQMNRSALALLNGVVYTVYASHGDNGPYHGWVLGYGATDLHSVVTFNTTPNGGLGGIWEGGGVPVFDANSNAYVVTGNGTFSTSPDGTRNFGESVIKLSPDGTEAGMSVTDFFTPYEQAVLNQSDIDQGSGGITLLPDQPGPHPHLLVQTGKRGKIFLLDRDNLGQYRRGPGCFQEPVLETCDNPVQFTPSGTVAGGSYGTPSYFNNGTNHYIYYGGNGDAIKQFGINPATGTLDLPPFSQSTANFGFTGVTPTISASGTSNGIVWGLNVNGYGIPARPIASQTILFAYDAADLGTLLYTSDLTGHRDRMGNAVKFNTPTVANGHVYVGTQTTLDVFGLFEPASFVPFAPSNLMAATGPPAPAPPSIVLTWTNNAFNATGVVIQRSLNGTDFMTLTTVGRDVNTFTDTGTGTGASTTYFYRVMATNQIGDSAPSNTASARTHIGPPALQVDDIFDTRVVLTWTATANLSYRIDRSTDGISFDVRDTVAASETKFTDMVPGFGTFLYRVTALNTDGDHADSNITSATVGPVDVRHEGGFATHADLTANSNDGRSIFESNRLRLTDGQNSEAGSVFTNSQVGIRRFTTSFTFQAQPGTVPMADGLTFIIQGRSPMALGAGGGGMGYQGIGNSVAIKFDLFNHGHGGYSTGLYVDGHSPDTPGAGEAVISLVGTGIDLTSGHPFTVDLRYDGRNLVETITDTITHASFTMDDYPPVDIPARVNSDTAFVGFGAGTGGFNAIQDILSWTFTADETGLPPRRPTSVSVSKIEQVDPTHFDITLGWKGNNAYTATGFRLERSTDGATFDQIGGDLPITQTSYTDANLTQGAYFYRLRSFNPSGNSAYTAVLCVPLAAAGEIDHLTGFACHGDLASNGNASFAGTFARLTDGGASEASSVFTLGKFDITHFTTSFALRIHDPANADGMTFVIQGNDPNQLGGPGGGLGYGSDTRGGPRGIRNSIAIKFDIYDNQGEGPNSTGLFGDGRSPTLPERDSGDILVDLTSTSIDLHSQHVFQVDLTYDGTTLTETITDTTTMNSFTTMYGSADSPLNIPASVGGNMAFIGFTGGTGGLTATQDVQTWTFKNQ
jgi:hypothetical protein